jgi:hypothetical protein
MNTRTDMKVRIQGTLIRSNQNTVRANTPNKIADALQVSSLKNFIKENNWAQGIIEFNSQTISLGGRNIAQGIIGMLNDLIKAEGVAELELEGKLTVLIETAEEPSVVRITVEAGKIRYQHAKLLWEPELVS